MKTTKAKKQKQKYLYEYKQGCASFEQGAGVDSCKYAKHTSAAKAWRTGWYDARTRSRLGHIFDRWKLDYP